MLSIIPTNMIEEKEKFFENQGAYNPEFKYSVKKIVSQ